MLDEHTDVVHEGRQHQHAGISKIGACVGVAIGSEVAPLQREGQLVFMQLERRHGAYRLAAPTVQLSDQDLADVYHLLSLLESDAAGVVATHASAAQMQELQDLHQQLEAAALPRKGDRDRFFKINEQFHMRLLEIANNRWRDQMVADLRKVMKLNRHNSLLKTGRIAESLAEHQAIMDALLAQDAALTRQRMAEHFANGLMAAE